jgi:hypothetical protein
MKVHTSKLKIKCLFRGKKRLKVYTSMSFLTSHMFLSPVCIICDFGPSSPLPVLICGSMEEDVKLVSQAVFLCQCATNILMQGAILFPTMSLWDRNAVNVNIKHEICDIALWYLRDWFE